MLNDYLIYIDKGLTIAIAVVLMIYILFSIILVRQFQLMSKVIISGVNKYVYFLVLAHLLFAMLISLIILFAI